MAGPNTTVKDTAGQWTAEIQRQVDRELASPTGSRPLVAEVAVGDLGNDPAAKDALTAAAVALVQQSPGFGS